MQGIDPRINDQVSAEHALTAAWYMRIIHSFSGQVLCDSGVLKKYTEGGA